MNRTRSRANFWSVDETRLAILLRDVLRMSFWEIRPYLVSRGHPERTLTAIQQHVRIYRPFHRDLRKLRHENRIRN